jgi:glycosyltransferase involved in cell wall biosynthesis
VHIVHVLSNLGFGGQERVAFDLAVGQTRAGHRVTTISLEEDGPLLQEYDKRGLEVLAMPKKESGFDFALISRIRDWLKQAKVDVVHTHNPLPLYYGGTAAKAARCKLVHTKHGINPAKGRQQWMRRAAGVLVDGYVAVSASTAEVARKEFECRPSRLQVIRNGTDLSRFSPNRALGLEVRRELGIPESAFVAGTVGRIYPEKAHPYLLDSLESELAQDFHVVIIGDGPKARQLTEKVAGMKRPESVHLLGLRRDIPRQLCAFDVFLLTSLYEGLPIVLPEAMASGLPVVATAVGGVPKVVVEGETGFLVESGDEKALRDRVRQLRSDDELRSRMGQRAQELAHEHYSSERMVRDYLDLYKTVLRA